MNFSGLKFRDDIKDVIETLLRKSDLSSDDSKNSTTLQQKNSVNGDPLVNTLEGEFINSIPFNSEIYRDALAEYIIQCRRSFSGTISDNENIDIESRHLIPEGIDSDEYMHTLHNTKISPMCKYDSLKEHDFIANDIYGKDLNTLAKDYEDTFDLPHEVDFSMLNISNFKLYGTNENCIDNNDVDENEIENDDDADPKIFVLKTNELYDDFEGACALPKLDSPRNINIGKDAKESIKQTTPQDSEDSCDATVHVYDSKVAELSDLPAFPKLVYFDARGIGETVRYLFAFCKMTYHDVRITRDEWNSIKIIMPLCQLPLLLIGDKILQHVTPIARYLGILGNIAGDSPLEVLEVDSMVETINDLRYQVLQAYYELDLRLKRRKIRSVRLETVPCYMKTFEKSLLENNGFLVLGKLTWADIFFVGLIEFLSFVSDYDLIDGYPELLRHCYMIHNLKGIRNWLKIRPQTDA